MNSSVYFVCFSRNVDLTPKYKYTPGNVVRGNQTYAKENLAGASGHELQSVDRISTNLLARYLQISKRKNRQFGNVVPNIFHFYTRLITKLHGKTSCQLLIWFLVWDKLSHYTMLGINKIKNRLFYLHVQPCFLWCRNESYWEPHCPIFQNLAANVFKCYENRSTHLLVYLFLMPIVMAGCTRKDFLCITFDCPLRHYQAWNTDSKNK